MNHEEAKKKLLSNPKAKFYWYVYGPFWGLQIRIGCKYFRLKRFIKRIKTEYKKHRHYMSIREIVKIAWLKSSNKSRPFFATMLKSKNLK